MRSLTIFTEETTTRLDELADMANLSGFTINAVRACLTGQVGPIIGKASKRVLDSGLHYHHLGLDKGDGPHTVLWQLRNPISRTTNASSNNLTIARQLFVRLLRDYAIGEKAWSTHTPLDNRDEVLVEMIGNHGIDLNEQTRLMMDNCHTHLTSSFCEVGMMFRPPSEVRQIHTKGVNHHIYLAVSYQR